MNIGVTAFGIGLLAIAVYIRSGEYPLSYQHMGMSMLYAVFAFLFTLIGLSA